MGRPNLFGAPTSRSTAEHFATTMNQLRGEVTMLVVSHALPKNLHVDEVVRLGSARTAVFVVWASSTLHRSGLGGVS